MIAAKSWKKRAVDLPAGLLLLFCGATLAHAQLPNDVPLRHDSVFESSLNPPAAAASPAPTAADAGETVITATKEATFDSSSHKAVFEGNVEVRDPQFQLTADRLTAFLKDEKAEAAAAEAKPGNGGSTTSESLQSAVAEGNVVVTQMKTDAEGKPTRYVGKGEKAIYNAKTGEVELSGWPQVQQGINTHVATEAGTVMTMSKDGRMRTTGGSRTVIQEQEEIQNTN